MLDTADLTDAWQQRFSFYDAYGHPSSSPQARQAFRQLPWWPRMRMNWNTLAYLFGPFYFFAKGMWRKGIVLLTAAVTAAVLVALLGPPEVISRAFMIAIPAIAATTANYGYYLHLVKGSRSWNPLEGFGRATTRS